MKITYLGTGSCFPTPTRNVSSIALEVSTEEIWIFDCGEGTQIQFQKTNLQFAKITKILITHLHGDHLFGLPGFLCTLGACLPSNHENEIHIYGPLGIKKFLVTTLEISRSAPKNCILYIHELVPDQDQFPEDWNSWKVDHDYNEETNLKIASEKICSSRNLEDHRCWNLISEDAKCSMKAVAIKHRVPSFAYVLNIKVPLDITKKPIRDSLKILVLGDTSHSEELIPFGMNADYVIHEATLEDSLKTRAIERGHSTPSMAVEFAIKINAKKLCLTHFNARYKPINIAEERSNLNCKTENDLSVEKLLEEAQNYLKNFDSSQLKICLAYDLFEDSIN